MEKRIIFATGNQDKMREIRMILSDIGIPILSMKEAVSWRMEQPLRRTPSSRQRL